MPFIFQGVLDLINTSTYLLDTAGNACLGLNVQRLDLLNECLLAFTLQTQKDEIYVCVCVTNFICNYFDK